MWPHLLDFGDSRPKLVHTRSMMEDFAVLMLLGVRVREVIDLAEQHIWLPDDRLLLIDAGLSHHQRSELASHLTPAAAVH